MRKVILIIWIAISISACDKFEQRPNIPIKYIANCNSCTIDYMNEDGIRQNKSISGDWNYAFMAKPGQYVYLSCSNKNYDAVIVVIERDGVILKTSKTSGTDITASVDGIIPNK